MLHRAFRQPRMLRGHVWQRLELGTEVQSGGGSRSVWSWSSVGMLLSHEALECFHCAASIRAIGGRTRYFSSLASEIGTWAEVTGVMVTVWLACAGTAVSPTPSTGVVYRHPTHRPMARSFLQPSRWLHVYRAGPRDGAAGARHLGGARLSMTPPDLVPRIRASHCPPTD
jgi:hypothetical protein